jgi:signal transduction histidine kinase
MYLQGSLVLAGLAVVVMLVVMGLEYRAFNREADSLRKSYLEEQKNHIRFDTDRVLRYIASEHSTRRLAVDEAVLKRQILSAISKLYGRPDGTGYIFIYNFDGICLSDPVQPQNIGKNLYDFKDPDGVQVIKELIDVSRQPDGGFVHYTWVKPTTKERSPKVSYARAFTPWKWMVGTGVYLDEIEKVIARKREALHRRMISMLLKLAALMALLFGVGLAGVGLINRIIRKETENFERFFAQAAQSHVRIDPRQVRLEEFRQMAAHVNTMVDAIHERKQRLREINALLEEKVAEQTADLRERNRQLARETAFNEELVAAQDRFIRSAIHEINTPLAVIMTQIDMYKLRHGSDRYLAKIEAGAKMISTIFDDLSYMVKKHRFDYPEGVIDLSEFVQERIRFFREIAEGNDHAIETQIEEGIEIRFSDVLLQRIIDNNLSNAIKYARRSTSIEVRLERQGGEAVLHFVTQSRPIVDTEQIFEPYHREVGEGEATVPEGFGLGLAIVRSICDERGVAIEVASRDGVTRFSYRFTIEKEAVDADTGTGG